MFIANDYAAILLHQERAARFHRQAAAVRLARAARRVRRLRRAAITSSAPSPAVPEPEAGAAPADARQLEPAREPVGHR